MLLFDNLIFESYTRTLSTRVSSVTRLGLPESSTFTATPWQLHVKKDTKNSIERYDSKACGPGGFITAAELSMEMQTAHHGD